MSQSTETPEARFAALVAAFTETPDVVPPEDAIEKRRMFGANGLRIHGHMFAMLTRDRLVVKLPQERVAALVAAGEGEQFDPSGHGRRMKEWLMLAPESGQDWLALAHEALAFVGKK